MGWSFRKVVFIILFIFCFAASSAFAAQNEGPIAVGRLIASVDGQTAPLQLDAVDISVTVEKQVAVTTVEHKFSNQYNAEAEGTFYCTIPEGTTLFQFALGIDDEPLKNAQVVPIDDNASAYNAVFSRGIYLPPSDRTIPLEEIRRDPGVAAYATEPQAFQASVSGIKPSEARRILIRFLQPVSMQKERLSYRLPLRMRDKAGRFSLTATIAGANQLAEVSTTELAATDFAATEDYVLTWKLRENPPELSCTYFPETESTGYFSAIVSPAPPEEKPARQVLFIVEKQMLESGIAKKLIMETLAELSEKDSFSILLADRKPQWLMPDFVENIREFRALAAEQLDQAQMTANNLLDTITLAFHSLDDVNSVIYCGAGFSDAGAIEKVLPGNKMKFAAVCTQDPAPWLKVLATGTRGSLYQIKENAEQQEIARKITASLTKPIIGGLQLKFQGVHAHSLYTAVPRQKVDMTDPRRNAQAVARNDLPDVPVGGQVVVMGRYDLPDGAQIEQARISAVNQKYSYEADFSRIDPESAAAVNLKTCWTGLHVQQVVPRLRYLDASALQQIVQMSCETGVISPFTFYAFPPEPKAGVAVDPRFPLDLWAARGPSLFTGFLPTPSSTETENSGYSDEPDMEISSDVDEYLQTIPRPDAAALTPKLPLDNRPTRGPQPSFSPLSVNQPELPTSRNLRYAQQPSSGGGSINLYGREYGTDLTVAEKPVALAPDVRKALEAFAHGPQVFRVEVYHPANLLSPEQIFSCDGSSLYLWQPQKKHCRRLSGDDIFKYQYLLLNFPMVITPEQYARIFDEIMIEKQEGDMVVVLARSSARRHSVVVRYYVDVAQNVLLKMEDCESNNTYVFKYSNFKSIGDFSIATTVTREGDGGDEYAWKIEVGSPDAVSPPADFFVTDYSLPSVEEARARTEREGDVNSLFTLARVLEETNPREAIAAVEKILPQRPDDFYLKLYRVLLQNKLNPNREKLLTRGLELLDELQQKLGDAPNAPNQLYDFAMTVGTESGYSFSPYATLNFQSVKTSYNPPAELVELAEKMYDWAPPGSEKTAATSNLAPLYALTGKAARGLALMRDCVRENPDDYMAWEFLGSYCARYAGTEEAEKALLKAHELEPDRIRSLTLFYEQNEQFDKALDVRLQDLKRDPSWYDVHEYFQLIERVQGKEAVTDAFAELQPQLAGPELQQALYVEYLNSLLRSKRSGGGPDQPGDEIKEAAQQLFRKFPVTLEMLRRLDFSNEVPAVMVAEVAKSLQTWPQEEHSFSEWYTMLNFLQELSFGSSLQEVAVDFLQTLDPPDDLSLYAQYCEVRRRNSLAVDLAEFQKRIEAARGKKTSSSGRYAYRCLLEAALQQQNYQLAARAYVEVANPARNGYGIQRITSNLWKQKNYKSFIDFIEKMAGLDPENARYYRLEALKAYRQTDPRTAAAKLQEMLADLDAAIAAGNDDAETRFYFHRTGMRLITLEHQESLKLPEITQRLREKAAAENGESDRRWTALLAEYLRMNGGIDEMLTVLESAAVAEKPDRYLLCRLAAAYAHQQQYSEAAAVYERAMADGHGIAPVMLEQCKLDWVRGSKKAAFDRWCETLDAVRPEDEELMREIQQKVGYQSSWRWPYLARRGMYQEYAFDSYIQECRDSKEYLKGAQCAVQKFILRMKSSYTESPAAIYADLLSDVHPLLYSERNEDRNRLISLLQKEAEPLYRISTKALLFLACGKAASLSERWMRGDAENGAAEELARKAIKTAADAPESCRVVLSQLDYIKDEQLIEMCIELAEELRRPELLCMAAGKFGAAGDNVTAERLYTQALNSNDLLKPNQLRMLYAQSLGIKAPYRALQLYDRVLETAAESLAQEAREKKLELLIETAGDEDAIVQLLNQMDPKKTFRSDMSRQQHMDQLIRKLEKARMTDAVERMYRFLSDLQNDPYSSERYVNRYINYCRSANITPEEESIRRIVGHSGNDALAMAISQLADYVNDDEEKANALREKALQLAVDANNGGTYGRIVNTAIRVIRDEEYLKEFRDKVVAQLLAHPDLLAASAGANNGFWLELNRRELLADVLPKLENVEVDEKHAAYLNRLLGYIYRYAAKDSAKAIKHYEAALQGLPELHEQQEILRSLISLYAEEEQWQKAIDATDVIREQMQQRYGAQPSQYLDQKAVYLGKLGKKQEARKAFSRYAGKIGTRLNDSYQHLRLAESAFDAGCYDFAVQESVVALNIIRYYQADDTANTTEALLRLAKALFALGESEKAIAALRAIPVKSRSVQMERYQDLTDAVAAVDENAAVVAEYEAEAADFHIEVPALRMAAGLIAREKGNLDKARLHFRAAYRLLPFDYFVSRLYQQAAEHRQE